MECVDICTPDSFDVIIRVARLYARLDAKGRRFEAPRTQYIIYGPPPSDDLADGSRDDQPSEPGVGARDLVPSLSAAPLNQPKGTGRARSPVHAPAQGSAQKPTRNTSPFRKRPRPWKQTPKEFLPGTKTPMCVLSRPRVSSRAPLASSRAQRIERKAKLAAIRNRATTSRNRGSSLVPVTRWDILLARFLGCSLPVGARDVPEATVGHGFTFIG